MAGPPRGESPIEELNEGAPSPARAAAAAIVMREAPGGPEVLLVQRNPAARFMGGVWVFPGGAVQPEDPSPAATARRELREEAGLDVTAERVLVPFSRWITPLEVKVRFDTSFFLTQVPSGAQGEPDGAETIDLRWLTPGAALDAGDRGELALVFPTIKHLEQLTRFASVEEALADARGRVVEPVLPRIVGGGSGVRVLLPGDSGYEPAS
jgi:8-oxo-dGTP pyrophosphatase MutT (NUDIX family)